MVVLFYVLKLRKSGVKNYTIEIGCSEVAPEFPVVLKVYCIWHYGGSIEFTPAVQHKQEGNN